VNDKQDLKVGCGVLLVIIIGMTCLRACTSPTPPTGEYREKYDCIGANGGDCLFDEPKP
jgi:hypothetical protein